MHRRLSRLATAAVVVLPVAAATGARVDGARDREAAVTMVDAAAAFVRSLDSARSDRALRDFDDAERFDWHFVPRDRTGLPLRDMTSPQRAAAHALLGSATSSAGYLKATGVMQLEGILGALEGRPDRRDPEDYHIWIFGTPSPDGPWAWRFEGHHVSISYTSVTGDLVVATPAFMGANPATVPSGPYAGWRLLGAEEDLARALVRSLSEEQRARAVIAEAAPADIITGAERRARLDAFEGLPASAMTEAQRVALMGVIREYVGNTAPEIAERQLAAIRDAGIERLHFAWAGPVEPGQGHYYRVHGPTLLIEYDNTQNDANHVHSVWRDLADDFGEDLLRRHYEEADHHQPPPR